MTRAILTVPDISCDHCKRAVMEALSPIEGVRAVDVDVAAKQVAVEYDDTVVDLNLLKETLAEEDYPVASATTA